MNCVNIKSRDFIHLAKRLNLSSNTLELIIHKYQAETGFDTAFPSDVYIQAQLGKDQYIEPSKAVRDLWEASYSTPQSFNSLQEYQRKYEEVKNYFPNEALVHYKDNENKDVLVVKKPVKELRPTINDYLDSDSHTKQEWDDYDFITRQLAANLKNNNNFAAANKIREQYVTDRKTEEGNTTFSHFDLKKPIKLKEKGIAADLKAIQANEWHLPEDIQKTVADKLQKYMDDKSGEIQEVDTVPYFGENGKTNAKDILTYITKNSTDKDIKTLASFVLKNLGKNENVPVSFSNNTRGYRGKYYTISHSVRINKASMTGNDAASAANNMEQTIIHEIAHAISVRAIETSPEIRKELLQIFKDYNQLKSQYGINTGYAAKNPKEFLAEFLGRKAFREALMALPSIGQENKKTKQTIGQRILNWLKNVLHIGNKSSFFKQADEVIQKVLDQANSQEFFYTDEMETAAEDRNPQPFTFNDGTVITAPFAPNKQQADALNAMNDFLNSNETTMTLSGYAGTGKTSLMEIIAQKARRQHKDIVFSATTNKAAAVLKSRVAKAGFDAQTLNKVFGINVEVDSSKAYNARNLVTALKEANVEPGTTVVIDEASMINEENYSILNRVARENSLKIIYVGDKAQLAPVNENQVSKVFRNSEGRIIELTKVERTDDNAILKEATNIRNGLPLSGESSFNERGEGVGYLTPKSREEVGRVIRHYIQGLKDNPNFFRILAYTNKAVTDYNNYVRSLLGYNDYVPHVGEPLTGYSNWGYEWRTKSYRFINSESYKVTKVGRPQTSSISINGENYTMQYVPITMENSLGETDTFNYMDVKGNQENRKAALQLATQKKTLWEQYRRAVGREAKSDILSQINSIDQFLFVNDNIEDPTTHNLLQPKTVDFGYALTIHKSQGSTFTHVLMDDIDVAKAGNTLNNAANAEDVYIGKDQWGASMDNIQGEAEEVDMGITEYDLNPAKYANPTTTTDNPNIANIRQQLEYVGVSRATNTVTIVATDANVKKEDSPLNHIKSSTNATPSVSQPVTIENTPKPADQMSKKELWEHLESLTEPMGERPVSYTPVGKTRQQYIVKDGKVYNKKGEEVHYQGKDMNKILANLAVAEDRGVVVTYRDNDYVVDNHQNITSVTSGDIMKWGPENGDRKTIIQLAEQKFKTLIENRQNRLSEMVPELMDLLKAQGINVNDKAAMEKFLKENPQWSTKIQQFIGKKARTQFEQQLMKARPDMATPGYTVDGIDFIKDPFSDDFISNRLDVVTAKRLQKEGIIKEGVFSEWALTDKGKEMAQVSHPEIDATLDFLHSLEDNKENTAYIKTAIRWIANRSLTLPQDHTKAYQAFELARKKHLDLQKYNTLGELITAPEMQPKKKEKVPFNPDKAKTFSNKRTVTTEGGRIFTVYDVENTEEGQREVCKALAAHYEMSPWCLSTFTATGEPTESAKNYWKLYKALPRKIAFENGKPVAFNSDKYGRGIAETVFRGTPIIVQGEEAIIDSTERGHLSRVTVDAWKQGGLVTESKIVPNALRLTEEAKKEIYNITGESWWDMEDTHPQDTLSDSIVSEPRKYGSELPDGVQLENDDFQADWENMADLYDETEFGFGRPGGNQHPLTQEEIDELPFMQTSEGDIYGFADSKGELYFDEEKVSPNVQIHEYTHLWDRAVAQRNPKLWKRGVDLMKQTSLWNEVLNDSNYGQKWQAVKGMTPEKMESLIASEVHSRLTGTQGEALLNRIAKEKGSKGIIAKLKQWMLDFWKELKGTFSNWSDEEINNLTLDDFNKMTVRDLVDKINLKEQQSTQQQVVGENISSKGSEFAKRLTNPFNNETVEFRGTKFDNAEHAYQTWKSGKFDQRGFDAHGGKVKGTTDYSSNYQTMVEILTAKLQQHPDLVEGIAERGGEAYLKASTHKVTGDKYWESTGQNKFIEALTEAYNAINKLSISSISDKTEAYGVEISSGSQEFWKKVNNGWQTQHPQGLVAYRKHGDSPKTFSAETVKEGWIGNPFSTQTRGENTVQQFYDWLVTGNNFGNERATEEFRQVIIQKILNTPEGSPILYYTELNRPSHATVIGFLVNNKHLLSTINQGDNRSNNNQIKYSNEFSQKSYLPDPNALLPVEAPEEPQRVSLPSYEYFMDKTEDTTVDAAWKIPMLQQLDEQLSSAIEEATSPDSEGWSNCNDILDRMTRILEAKNQEDLLNLLSDEPKTNEKVEQNLTEFEKMTQQINNLLDSNIISASEIRHVAELVVNSISDTITILQKEEGAAEKFFPNIQTDLDFKSASRKEIVEAIDINNLIHRAKQQFDPEQNDYEDFDTMEQADLIIDNWDAIMTLAADTFSMNEGFGIMRNYDKGGFATTQNSTVDFDNFNDYSNDPDAMAESEKDEQEHWQVEQRTIDILNSMSQMVRLALHECYQMDREGNKVMSKWGIAERINPRKAVNSILRWTQGSLTLEDMINKMQGKATQNPWLNQLIERLSDKSGNETDFQSQFFGVFSKHFQPYSVVLLEDGKYHSIPVNSHPALSEAMQTITTQFKIGEHSLFTDRGINRKLLGSDSTINANSPFNLHQALAALNLIQDRLQHGEQLDNDMSKEAAANIMGVCRVMGYPITEEMLSDVINEENLSKMTTNLGFIVRSLDAAREEQFKNAGTPNAKVYNPFAFKSENGIAGSLRNFLTPITDTLEDTAVSAFYDSGKMYQSYVTPSFMTKLMNKFRLEGKEFEDFIMQEYGGTEWFKSAKNQWDVSKGWRNEWLRLLATDENARKVFDHKVELNFNKHNYMRNMSDAEYTLSLITEYFAETGQKKEALVPAWFRVPIMSNKPSSEFIKFYSYRGANYKDEIIYGLHQMFNQELSRIQTVNMRNRSKGDADFIANFDTNGRKFNFLPFLNKYLNDSKGLVTGSLYATDGSFNNGIAGVSSQTILKQSENRLRYLLNKKIYGLEALTAEEEAELSTLVDQAIRQDMENRVATILNQWEKSGIIETAKSIEGIGTEEAQIRANLENFLWNDNFASKNILQLTVTDIAFYKDAEDLQKRLAQIHAPGIRGNVTATDYKGDRVSDGKYRTVLIQGLQKFKTDLIANIAEVFERKIAAAPEGQKAQLRALKESLVGEKGRYTKIDVTDGQAYSSPSSYRKKAFIFGKWSKHAEDIYQKLLKGDYNYSDLEVAFQPLKPFVYTHLQKNMGVDSAPIHQIPVPFQAKNSEYLLIMADALIKGEEAKSGKLSRPNILGAIYRIMEDSAYDGRTYDEYGNIKDYGTYNKRGIDTIQFDSAIKSGLQAPIDLNPFLDMESGEEAAYEHMKRMIYKSDDQGNPSNEYATDTYVHEGLYEDYCLQQEVPEHFKNHSQAHGSQIRMIIPSDLDFYKNPNADHNDPNNQVFYEWTEPDGTKKKLRADEFRREYEQTIADNIRESIDQLSQELHINSENKKERNIALSKILQREILSSPRYGIDLIQACSIDKETGEFRIPKGDPIQAKRIEQLINSIIKNRVNKQKIAGGPIVQVTNFGASRQLHIRFNSKEGGLLMTREEYEKNPQKKEMSQTDKFNARYGRKTASGNMTYEEYVKQNQAGIAYFEVFIPMWANEIFEKFSNEDGSINMEALEATDPELLKMISYRIPTEDKYSCAPMKAVGFLPREAGDAIMFPYELTEIDDSDFDVDKRYVMRKDIPIVRKPKHIIHKELFDIVEESYKKQHGGKELPANIASEIEVFLDSPDTMRSKSAFTKWLYSQYQKIAYTTKAPTSGRKYRDNKIVDMTWAVLTNEMTADKILNPGGFDVFKRAGYMVAAYKNPANNYSWGQLQQMSIDELNKLSYTDKDLTWLDTQIQFYKQNAAASSLIGVFAVNKVAHATLESNDYYLAVNEICGDEPFIIAGTEFGGRMKIDPSHDSEGNLIGKTIGAGVSASADAAKTPVLNLMNINMTTAGIFNTLLRLGMAPNDASLFMSQEVIERILNEFNRENLTNYKPLSTIIGEHIGDLRDKYKITDSSNINTEPLSREELVEGLTPEEHEVIDYKVLLAFQKVRSLVDAIRKPTFATRFNSISSAVGPLIIDNLIMEHKMEQFRDVASENGTHIYDSEGNNVDIDDIFYDHPILREFSRTVDIAKVMFSDMPAGSTGFRELLATLPEGLSDKVYNDKKLLDNLSNFYQSYLLIASRMVNPANLKRFIDGFPKYFNDQKFKEKYADNALIQAIRMNVSKRTGRPFLSINITGIDESQKEVYRSAWIDLHKDNPELSKQLFEYCFFRAGVGFSPKTFMSLVPTYVKERLFKDLGNGSQATYVDTYRRFPSVNPNVVLDQWVRNNWDNNKLVPKKGGEDTHYIVDLKRGTLIAKDPKDMADLQDCTYIKTRHNGQTYLWKQIIADKTAVNYVMVKPLGNNAEYLEMSLSDITKPMSETKETIEDMQESELQTVSPAEADAAGTSTADNITDTEKVKRVSEFADLIMQQNPKLNKTQAMNLFEKMKEKPDLYAGFLVNVYKQKGLNLTKEEALAEFKKLC